jgi:cytochrome oxidase Cu insertion factor (SCO1/SenC/PrrC family)
MVARLTSPDRRRPILRSRLRVLTAAGGAVVAAALALAGCSSAGGSSSQAAASPSSSAAASNPNLDLGTSLGDKAAPNVKLTNQFGQSMSLSQFRGKAVVLGFVDSECTTVCPLTTLAMLEAKQMLGKAGDQVQLLGIDANPDAIATSDVLAYSRVHNMVNRWDFLTSSLPQLKATWKSFDIYAKVVGNQIDHTPALYVIDPQGRERVVYLTPMAYSSITQSAQVIAQELASVLPGHPVLTHAQSLAYITGQTPHDAAKLDSATGNSATGNSATGSTTVTLGPGKAHLVMFYATWLTETMDLKSQLLALNGYTKTAAAQHLPALTAVDEAVTEPGTDTAQTYLKSLGGPLDYPVALDTTGRLADGYGVQDQPWFDLVSASGKTLWSHDGFLPAGQLTAAVAKYSAASGS